MGGSPSADLGPDAVADEGIADGAPADAVPDAVAAPDGGDAMVEPDAALCAFEPRCDARIAETCVDGQATQTVCERSERCLNGACEALPEDIYGAVCSIPGLQQECERLGFACGGIAATLFCLHPNASAGPIEIGEECYGPRECVGGGRCTRTGRCATGAEGTLCIDDDDCVGRCVRNACGRAEAESAPNANGR